MSLRLSLLLKAGPGFESKETLKTCIHISNTETELGLKVWSRSDPMSDWFVALSLNQLLTVV